MRRMDVAQRRARLGVRHRLAPSAQARDPVEVARDLVAVHSTDAAGVYLAMLARMRAGGLAAVQRALYDDRTLVRVMGMRRTVFAVPVELASVVIAGCGAAIAERERRTLRTMLLGAAVAEDVDGWLKGAEDAALASLALRGEARAAEIAADDPRLDTTIVLNEGKRYEGRQKVASRVLTLLAAEGRIVRARPVGSWRSSQYRWSLMSDWLAEPMTDWTPEQAQTELARRWLAAFGPATVADFQWWSGLSGATVKRAFGRLDLTEVDLDGASGVVLADDEEPVPPAEPWVALLPTLDSTPMGWKLRDWYLDEHGPKLTDGTGNISPTVWCDGCVVGGWAQRANGEIVVKLLADVGSERATEIGAAAERLGGHIGPVRLAPRARGLSAVERELIR